MKWRAYRDWNRKSVYYVIIWVAVAFIFFFLKANSGHFALLYAQRSMTGETEGTLIERDAVHSYKQTTTGNRQTTKAVNFDYAYKVNGIQYHEHQNLAYSFLDAEKLDKLSSMKVPCKIKVKYNIKHPYLSSISLNN